MVGILIMLRVANSLFRQELSTEGYWFHPWISQMYTHRCATFLIVRVGAPLHA